MSEKTKRPFILVGNHLAMDFINTLFRCHGEDVDLLSSIDDFGLWAEEMSIELDADNREKNLEAVRALRSALKTLMLAQLDQEVLPETAVEIVNKHLYHAPTQQKFLLVEQEVALQPLFPKLSVEQVLGKIAREAAELLTSDQRQHIKSCSNEKCVLLFVDTSRAKKRRWCCMERCGNRAKAANFYHANKASD
ncbi:CGNR zinc finger domain-containing protein [Marinomonas sp. GJ51-6]|uniref:CGNR zinc finger domain-containing protein n=1 Tax=Marinomonas sp. GJ51-6 TaxID=2992802 RepID=UPI002934B444|nr:CGNR zinc finger domain-containing protein [Marinomonas sp. GJ51-6]WOD08940.1 CGNR zinc finger domain-containing protein [Marinomonas sp. GJ51-6]